MRIITLCALVAACGADQMCTDECGKLSTQNDLNRDVGVVYDSACAQGGFGCNVQGHEMCRYCSYQNFSAHQSPKCPACAMPTPPPPPPPPKPDSTQMCTDECDKLSTEGDLSRGLSVVYDSACAQGGFGCNVQGHEMCRYCNYWNSSAHQSTKCPACVMRQPVRPTPPPKPPAAATQSCTDECDRMVTQDDLNRDVGVVYDSACAQGGFGCNVQGHKMCRYCSHLGRRLGHHQSAQCPACAMPVRPTPPVPPPPPPKPDNGPTCDSFCDSLNNDNDKFSYDQLIIYDPSCVNGGAGCNAKGARQTCRYCSWRSREGSHPTSHCPSCACIAQGLNGCDGPSMGNSTGAIATPATKGTLTFTNKAANTVTLMRACTAMQTVAPGDTRTMTITGNNKFWIAPQGFKYNCELDCLDCFYISAIVAGSGAVVTGIGYGWNTPVRVHDGVSALDLTATREDNKMVDEATCSTSACAFEHIIPGFHTSVVLHGGQAPPAPTPATRPPPAPTPPVTAAPPVPAVGMSCNPFCNSLNNDNDKFSYDQLVVYDPTCVKGGIGCNAKGASQTCRFCTWRSRSGSHGTTHCPPCACAQQGLNGCVGSAILMSNSSTILI